MGWEPSTAPWSGPAHLAFFNIPAYGHVLPTLATVAELVRRGHRVSYCVPETFAGMVRAAGAQAVPYPTTLPSADRVADWPTDDPVALHCLAFNEASSVLPVLATAFVGDLPDLVLYDFGAFAGRLLAHRWRVPAICLSSTHVTHSSPEERRQRRALFDEVFADDPRWSDYQRHAKELLAREGIDMPIEDFIGEPERCLVPMPREFQIEADRVDDRFAFVGPCIDETLRPFEFVSDTDAEPWHEPGPDRPVVLVALGSAGTDQRAFYRNCIEAFTGTSWHAVLAIGRRSAPADFGPVPSNIELRRHVPQLQLLARATAFVTHAGMGSCLEAIYHGVPMVAVPQVNDQIANARRIEELGIGVRVPLAEATAGRIRATVDEVAGDADMAGSLAVLRTAARAGGAARAADLIETQLGSVPPLVRNDGR